MTVTYASLLGQIQSGGLDLSQPFQDLRLPPSAGSTGWKGLAAALEELWKLTSQRAAVFDLSSATAAAVQRYLGPEQGTAVDCGDTVNPRNPQRYNALEPFVLGRAGRVGLPALWTDEICASWPARSEDRYLGPWNRRTANPILVVGNTGDPSTPYVNSVGMAAQLSRARLLTVRGWGHTEMLNPSTCANAYITAYLLRKTFPPAHTICRQDKVPFAK
jgi:pimeloyl-ACP methyl ester carboxylesterase